MHTDSTLQAAFIAGYQAAMKNYAIYKDGEQFIGVMQKPLKPELEKVAKDKHVLFEYKMWLDDQNKINE